VAAVVPLPAEERPARPAPFTDEVEVPDTPVAELAAGPTRLTVGVLAIADSVVPRAPAVALVFVVVVEALVVVALVVVSAAVAVVVPAAGVVVVVVGELAAPGSVVEVVAAVPTAPVVAAVCAATGVDRASKSGKARYATSCQALLRKYLVSIVWLYGSRACKASQGPRQKSSRHWQPRSR
jgi:hypothetical protein